MGKKTEPNRNKSVNSRAQSPFHLNSIPLQFLQSQLPFHPQEIAFRPQNLRLKPPLLLRKPTTTTISLLLHPLSPPLPQQHYRNTARKPPSLFVEQGLQLPPLSGTRTWQTSLQPNPKKKQTISYTVNGASTFPINGTRTWQNSLRSNPNF